MIDLCNDEEDEKDTGHAKGDVAEDPFIVTVGCRLPIQFPAEGWNEA